MLIEIYYDSEYSISTTCLTPTSECIHLRLLYPKINLKYSSSYRLQTTSVINNDAEVCVDSTSGIHRYETRVASHLYFLSHNVVREWKKQLHVLRCIDILIIFHSIETFMPVNGRVAAMDSYLTMQRIICELRIHVYL
jgi:hypothetical protein